MMRYLILAAMLLCLPVRGEAWQVVGGGAAQELGFCASNAGATWCEDFVAPKTWVALNGNTLTDVNIMGKAAKQITAADNNGTANNTNSGIFTTGATYYWEVKLYKPCSGGTNQVTRVSFEQTSATDVTATCGSWQSFNGTFTATSAQDDVEVVDRYSTTGTVVSFTDFLIRPN